MHPSSESATLLFIVVDSHYGAIDVVIVLSHHFPLAGPRPVLQ
jgi:hypothetical protein